ncbi:E3 SUMO-protein ligase ZBED1-like [Genypterus blacodes]|uniref:E3 SUMO-protein ligase ZBED1-like n=1 Tax=Genypterus blacodes TaxID=154954 RepID=UPI003F7620D5
MDEGPVKKRPKSSVVWEHFTLNPERDRVVCRHCNRELRFHNSTTSMQEHLKRKHTGRSDAPVDTEGNMAASRFCMSKMKQEEDVKTSLSLDQEGGLDQSDAATLLSPNMATSRIVCSGENVEREGVRRSSVWDIFVKKDDEVHCQLCDLKLKYSGSSTSMMFHMRSRHTESTGQDGRAIPLDVTALISRMITKDMLPIDVIDGEGFRDLLASVVRNYKVPPSGEIMRIIEGHYEEKVEELRAQLCRAEKVALTADCWTGHPLERYITISCSFITEDWKGRTAVLKTHRLSKSWTDRVLETVAAWDLAAKVNVCVHNNTRDIVADRACSHVPWDSVVCFATTLHEAVIEGLSDDLLTIIVAAGRLVKYFKHNLQASEALMLMQTQMCLPQNQLIQSRKDRWDTICDMFQRLLEQRWAIKAVLANRTVVHRQEAQAIEIEDDYWQVIVNFTPVLATLKWATTVISAESEVSISNIYPITFSLIGTHLVPKESDVKQVSEFKLKVQRSLRNQMEVDSSDLASKPAMIACMLDPRHKHLGFLTPMGRVAAKVKLHELVSKFDKVTTPVITKIESQEALVTPEIKQSAVTSSSSSSHVRDDTKTTMMLLLGDNYSSSYSTDSEAQVDYYLRDISASLVADPLDWWRINSPRFPRVATLAKHYLCIPGVSLPPLLSQDGQTFAKSRARLNSEHADMMIFLNRNVELA